MKKTRAFISLLILSLVLVISADAESGKKAVSLSLGSPALPMVSTVKEPLLNAVSHSPSSSNLKRAASKTYPLGHYQLGLYFRQQGKIDDALVQFLKAVQENPKLIKAFYEQALIFKTKGFTKLAQSALEQALAVKPDFWEARVLLATIFLEAGDFTNAAAELARSLGLDKTRGELCQKCPAVAKKGDTFENISIKPSLVPSTVMQVTHGMLGESIETSSQDSKEDTNISSLVSTALNTSATTSLQETEESANPDLTSLQKQENNDNVSSLSSLLKGIPGLGVSAASVASSPSSTSPSPITSSQEVPPPTSPSPTNASLPSSTSTTFCQTVLSTTSEEVRPNSFTSSSQDKNLNAKAHLLPLNSPFRLKFPNILGFFKKAADTKNISQTNPTIVAKEGKHSQTKKTSLLAKLFDKNKTNLPETKHSRNTREAAKPKDVSEPLTMVVRQPIENNALAKAVRQIIPWLPPLKEKAVTVHSLSPLPAPVLIGKNTPTPSPSQIPPKLPAGLTALQPSSAPIPNLSTTNIPPSPLNKAVAFSKNVPLPPIQQPLPTVANNLASKILPPPYTQNYRDVKQAMLAAAPKAVPVSFQETRTPVPLVPKTPMRTTPKMLAPLPTAVSRLPENWAVPQTAAPCLQFSLPSLSKQSYALPTTREHFNREKQAAAKTIIQDEWSERMKYLVAHGTSTLGAGEAFMFSEETGEGIMFLPGGKSIRRIIADPKDPKLVASLRRPDILAPSDLQYNLSLLGKLLPKKQEKIELGEQPPITSLSLNELLGKSQGFWGWIKNIFKL